MDLSGIDFNSLSAKERNALKRKVRREIKRLKQEGGELQKGGGVVLGENVKYIFRILKDDGTYLHSEPVTLKNFNLSDEILEKYKNVSNDPKYKFNKQKYNNFKNTIYDQIYRLCDIDTEKYDKIPVKYRVIIRDVEDIRGFFKQCIRDNIGNEINIGNNKIKNEIENSIKNSMLFTDDEINILLNNLNESDKNKISLIDCNDNYNKKIEKYIYDLTRKKPITKVIIETCEKIKKLQEKLTSISVTDKKIENVREISHIVSNPGNQNNGKNNGQSPIKGKTQRIEQRPVGQNKVLADTDQSSVWSRCNIL